MVALILSYLHADSVNGSVIEPCEYNARILWDVGLAAAEAGFPSLVHSINGEITGYVMMVPLLSPYILKGRILQDCGVYVKHSHRGKRISSKLRIAAKEHAKSIGIDTILGTIYGVDLSSILPTNQRESSVIAGGFNAYGICGRIELGDKDVH